EAAPAPAATATESVWKNTLRRNCLWGVALEVVDQLLHCLSAAVEAGPNKGVGYRSHRRSCRTAPNLEAATDLTSSSTQHQRQHRSSLSSSEEDEQQQQQLMNSYGWDDSGFDTFSEIGQDRRHPAAIDAKVKSFL
uniref:GIT1_C domain-containing protein n=1 Tax=Macrostomum lignano TaxID=282301 RepID=A0A1I8IVJ7_9PLAT